MGDCAPFHGTRNIVAVDDSPGLEEHRVVSKWQAMYLPEDNAWLVFGSGDRWQWLL